MKTLKLIALGSVVALASSAFAGSKDLVKKAPKAAAAVDSGFFVGGFGGLSYADYGSTTDEEKVYGGKVGYDFGNGFSAAAVYDQADHGTDVKTYSLNGSYDLPVDVLGVKPYVSAGAGYQETGSNDGWIYNVGAGLGYALTKNVGLDLGYTYRDNLKDSILDGSVNQQLYTAGVSFKF